jgi:hypothetical protein
MKKNKQSKNFVGSEGEGARIAMVIIAIVVALVFIGFGLAPLVIQGIKNLDLQATDLILRHQY